MNEFIVNINSDGTVQTLSPDGLTISCFCGELPILHAILKHTDIPKSKISEIPIEHRIFKVKFYFCINGKTEKLEIPKKHITNFCQHIIKNKFLLNLSYNQILNKENYGHEQEETEETEETK